MCDLFVKESTIAAGNDYGGGDWRLEAEEAEERGWGEGFYQKSKAANRSARVCGIKDGI